jgi:hypothetical protein
MDAYDLLIQHAATGNGRGVAVEDEAVRIRDLPRADYEAQGVVDHALSWATETWSRGPACPMQFRSIQAVALFACHLNGGGFLPVGTGHGKELISRLAASALGARRPILLIPPDMREPFALHTSEYARSFKLPGNLRVMAYSQLSQASSTDALEKLAPDALVMDEAHCLRNADAARTKRVIRYLRDHPMTKVVLMSGTLTSKGIQEYAHLAEWALKHRSPVPRKKFFPCLQSFSAILDAKPTRQNSAGNRFVSEPMPHDWAAFSPLFPDWKAFGTEQDIADEEAVDDPEALVSERVARAREVWRDRLRHSPGVVATSTASVQARLCLVRRQVRAPSEVLIALERLNETWQRPDGEELVDAIAKWRCGRQLSQGFYYRWKWPEGEPTDADKEWLRTRAAWHKEVRRVCGHNRPHLDSPMLVARAARMALRGEPSALKEDAALLYALEEWIEHEHRRWSGRDTPPTETVWVSDYLVRDALAWFEQHPKGLIFYAETAMADALAEAGVQIYGGGTNPEELQGRKGAALSVNSHRQGKNLQKHHECLILSFEPHAGNMEQLLSRTHRAGQREDEVWWWYYAHTEPAQQAILDARTKALYTQTTMGDPQRLCYADWIEESC